MVSTKWRNPRPFFGQNPCRHGMMVYAKLELSHSVPEISRMIWVLSFTICAWPHNIAGLQMHYAWSSVKLAIEYFPGVWMKLILAMCRVHLKIDVAILCPMRKKTFKKMVRFYLDISWSKNTICLGYLNFMRHAYPQKKTYRWTAKTYGKNNLPKNLGALRGDNKGYVSCQEGNDLFIQIHKNQLEVEPTHLKNMFVKIGSFRQVAQVGVKITHTPWKINMEPEYHLFEKENHLPNLHFWGSMWIFRGDIWNHHHLLEKVSFHQPFEPWPQLIPHLPGSHIFLQTGAWLQKGNPGIPDSVEVESCRVKGGIWFIYKQI